MQKKALMKKLARLWIFFFIINSPLPISAYQFYIEDILEIHGIVCSTLIHNRGLLLICTRDKTAVLISIKTGKIIQEIDTPERIVSCAASGNWVILHLATKELIAYKFLSFKKNTLSTISSVKNITTVYHTNSMQTFVMTVPNNNLHAIVKWHPEAPDPYDFVIVAQNLLKPYKIKLSEKHLLAEYRFSSSGSHFVLYDLITKKSYPYAYPNGETIITDFVFSGSDLISAGEDGSIKFIPLPLFLRKNYFCNYFELPEKDNPVCKLCLIENSSFMVRKSGKCELWDHKKMKKNNVFFHSPFFKKPLALEKITTDQVVDLFTVASHKKLFIITQSQIIFTSYYCKNNLT